jgi:uncharacterized protein YdaU (DUF1376 family)
MAKDPRFNFYPDNYIGGTRRMSFEQKGAYLELIILNFYCFSDGLPGFTKEDALKALACAAACAELWIFLMPKFQTDGTYYWSERLMKEFIKAKSNSEKQSEKAKKRWSDAAAVPAADAYNGYGSGNGNEDGIELKGVQGENEVKTLEEVKALVFAEPIFLSRLQDSHPGKDYDRAFAECYAYFMNRPNPPNMLWVWRQKLLTWLSNMNETKQPMKPRSKKLTVKDLDP